ncbi:hypothetical protein [Microcoleus sp. FACHB-831]|nr:hypothetical protein [Microcoleus sp. FACHB-831]
MTLLEALIANLRGIFPSVAVYAAIAGDMRICLSVVVRHICSV